jgi:hypothetical protein
MSEVPLCRVLWAVAHHSAWVAPVDRKEFEAGGVRAGPYRRPMPRVTLP